MFSSTFDEIEESVMQFAINEAFTRFIVIQKSYFKFALSFSISFLFYNEKTFLTKLIYYTYEIINESPKWKQFKGKRHLYSNLCRFTRIRGVGESTKSLIRERVRFLLWKLLFNICMYNVSIWVQLYLCLLTLFEVVFY